jgi:membrane fusion protein
MEHKDSSICFFRPEVTASDLQLGLGVIRLSQPIAGWLAANLAFLALAAFLGYVALGSIARKDRATGITVPVGGNIGVFASSSGVVTKFLVTEGDVVKPGQPLFEVSTEREIAQGEVSALVAQQLYARKSSLEAEQALRAIGGTERREAIQRKIVHFNAEVAQIQQEIVLAEQRRRLTQGGLARYKTLNANSFISGVQLEQKEQELLEADARVANLKRNRLQIQENILEAKAEQKTLARTVAIEQVQFTESLANIKQQIAENDGRKSVFITAPQAGIVATIICQRGQVLSAGQALATLIPSSAEQSRLEAQLYVPSRTAGFVAPGQPVLIRFHAFPYEKFGLQRGTVIDVSKNPLAPNELPQSLASTILSYATKSSTGYSNAEGLYRIKVRLDHQGVNVYGKLQKLKPGMTLEADIFQERRKIWEWFAEPILAVTQRQAPN